VDGGSGVVAPINLATRSVEVNTTYRIYCDTAVAVDDQVLDIHAIEIRPLKSIVYRIDKIHFATRIVDGEVFWLIQHKI